MAKSARLPPGERKKFAKASWTGCIRKSWTSRPLTGGRRIPPPLRISKWTNAKSNNIRWSILLPSMAKRRWSAIHRLVAPIPLFTCSLFPSRGASPPKQMDTGSETDLYFPRVNWLPDSKHLAIQRLNRAQTDLDLMIAESTTGESRIALTEKDQYWINVSDDLRFLQDGKRFLWSSERTGYRHLYIYNLEGKETRAAYQRRLGSLGIECRGRERWIGVFHGYRKIPYGAPALSSWAGRSGFTRVTKEPGTHAVNFPGGFSGDVSPAASIRYPRSSIPIRTP